MLISFPIFYYVKVSILGQPTNQVKMWKPHITLFQILPNNLNLNRRKSTEIESCTCILLWCIIKHNRDEHLPSQIIAALKTDLNVRHKKKLDRRNDIEKRSRLFEPFFILILEKHSFGTRMTCLSSELSAFEKNNRQQEKTISKEIYRSRRKNNNRSISAVNRSLKAEILLGGKKRVEGMDGRCIIMLLE